LSTLTPAEGDYVPLRVDSTGALYVTGVGGGGGGGGVVNADLIQVLNSAKAPDGGSLVPVTVERAPINVSSAGENVLVEGVSNKAFLVLALFLMAQDSVAVTFLQGSGGSPVTGDLLLTAGSGFVLPYNPLGWFLSGVDGEGLILSLSNSAPVGGCIVYAMVPSASGPE